MKKIIALALAMTGILAIQMTGCTAKSSAITFSIETGDKIKVELDTLYGHKLSQSGGDMYLSDKDGTFTLTGSFILPDYYAAYEEQFASAGEASNVIETGNGATKAGQSYSYAAYTNDDGSTGIMIMLRVPNATCGVIFIGDNVPSVDDARTAFNLLSFSKE